MSEEADIDRKIKKAARMLFLPRHQTPGVKGGELHRSIGKDYIKIIEVMKEGLGKLDLQVRIIFEDGEERAEPTKDDLDKAKFFVTSKNPVLSVESGTSGWRIDDLAILSASLAYILSRNGKSPKRDIETLLREKFPKWKVSLVLERFIKRGYLVESRDRLIYVGWRTHAEIDQKTLLNLILSTDKNATN